MATLPRTISHRGTARGICAGCGIGLSHPTQKCSLERTQGQGLAPSLSRKVLAPPGGSRPLLSTSYPMARKTHPIFARFANFSRPRRLCLRIVAEKGIARTVGVASFHKVCSRGDRGGN